MKPVKIQEFINNHQYMYTNCFKIQTFLRKRLYIKRKTHINTFSSRNDMLNEWLFLPKALDVLIRLAMCFCMGMHSPVIPRWYIIPVWLDTNWLSNRTFCLKKEMRYFYKHSFLQVDTLNICEFNKQVIFGFWSGLYMYMYVNMVALIKNKRVFAFI